MIKKSVMELLAHVKQEVGDMIDENPYGYIDGIAKIASKIEKSRKYRIIEGGVLKNQAGGESWQRKTQKSRLGFS